MDWLNNVKRLGRTFEMEETLWCGPSGSGVEFQLKGGKCKIMLVGDERAPDSHRTARVAVTVDGKRVVDTMMNRYQANEEQVISVSGNEDGTPVIVRVIKLSEAQDSSFGIMRINAEGAVCRAPDRDRKIEFIGDSITCAYGVDAEIDDEYRTNDEDAEKGYACITAELLKADFSIFAMSGFGVLSGYSDDGKIHSDGCVPKYYDSIGISEARFGGLVFPQDVKWDFKRFKPDTVVINLGTNDWSYCRREPSGIYSFTEKYEEFIGQIREKNPDARIICTLGILGDQLFKAVTNAVNSFREKTGDERIDLFRFEEQNIELDGVAECGHPSYATHAKAAKALAEYLSAAERR